MSKQNKDIFDRIDEYFSTIDSEEIAKKITKGVDDLSKNISDSIEGSFKKQPKPNFSKFLNEATSRYEYVKEEIRHNTKSEQYIGQSKLGYTEAIKDIQSYLIQYTNDLDVLYKRIQNQIKEVRLRNTQYNRNYINGYINGCEFVLKAIRRSKRVMMDKIMNELI